MAASLQLAAVGAHGEEGYFQQHVRYTIRVRLDTEQHTLTGTQTIVYRNNSPDTLDVFYLHLYPNAFTSKNTPLLKDYRRRFNFSFIDLPKKYRGNLVLSDVAIDGVGVTPDVEHTVAKLDLPSPLAPGDSMVVSLGFVEKIRRHLGRAGYRGEQYDLAQWYPKVAVYDERGFHADQLRTGEFYGEFGTFDVFLEVPEHYVVAATGVPRRGDPGWSLNPVEAERPAKRSKDAESAYKTVHFTAENVHDFAWNASPHFAVQDTTWNGVEIKSFFNLGNNKWRDSTLVHGLRAVEWLSERVGPYPYPQVSIVQALLDGGMEYPMLVMNGKVGEGLVFHEIGHIYFYGILANDERAEAWLDEGFTTFQTDWYMTDRYGPYGKKSAWNWYERMTPQYTLLGARRAALFWLERRGYGERVSTRAEDYKHSYRQNVYYKAALLLFALKYTVGDEDFERILQRYFATWKFRHVTGQRFKDVCEEVTGKDLTWFFEQWSHTRKICDYRLGEVKSTRRPAGDGYDVSVRVDRLGEIIMPVEVEFTFKDGTVERTRLDGRLRTIKETFQFPEKPKSAALNPDNEILDINMTDNHAPQKWDLQIDWPNNSYYPEHAYQIRHRPYVWYNDVDRLRIGYHLSGSFFGFYRRFQLGLYYGLESERLDFSTSYKVPTRTFGLNGAFEVSGYMREGRQDVTLSLAMRRRPELIRPPTQQLTLAFNYHELKDSAYVINPKFYQGYADVAPLEIKYEADPQFDILRTKSDIGVRFGREWFGGKYKYTSFYGMSNLETRRSLVPFDFGMRVFLGIVSGSMPNQQKFNLAGGGVLEQEKVFFLRSPGALWPNNHYLMPGEGNLRGYAVGTFPVNKLLTANFKLGGNLPWISQPRDRWLGEIKLNAFADLGTIFDSNNPIAGDSRIQALFDAGVFDRGIVDAGLGLRMRRSLPFWDLYVRWDVPFFVNVPEINGETDKTDFRYIFSLTSVFSLDL
jgi:hypothetical protein